MGKGYEDFIRDVPLLARLPEGELRALAARGRARTYVADAVIFHEGDPGDSLHIVIDGAIRIALISSEGEERTVALLGPGEFVGHLALLDGRPRSASAIAHGPTTTLVVTRDDFRRWLAERPPAALALLEAMSLLIRRTDEVLADMTFLGLPKRLAKRVLDLVGGLEGTEAEGRRLRITQAELASMLGVSRESVNRQLNVFAQKGWIALGRGSITVIDLAALRVFLEAA